MGFNYLFQVGSDFGKRERLAIMQSRSLRDDEITYACLNDIQIALNHVKTLKNCIPVGTVEFCRSVAKIQGIELPEELAFLKELKEFYAKPFSLRLFKNVPNHFFVKPAKEIKLFNGGVKESLTEVIDPNTPVWSSEPVEFQFEWRGYILDGKTVGLARYDDREEDTPDDLIKKALQCIEEIRAKINEKKAFKSRGYSIDIGLIKDDKNLHKIKLIEINDGWALGLYKTDDLRMNDKTYAKIISTRWSELLSGS
ncbi:MAG: ATP-grasp domain-containing protein [Methyloprofundus sp.]|nr:ATP-grasp domain-containing protein [Methyloprofundus sp.]